MYINRYFNFFDPWVSRFVTGDLIRQQNEETYNDKLIKLDKEDKFYAIKLNCLKTEQMWDLEAAENFYKMKKVWIWLIMLKEKMKLLQIKKLKVW